MDNFNLKKFLGEKSLLKENAPGYNTRKFGEALPTLENVKAAYEAKEKDLEDDSYEVDGTSVGSGKYEDEESEKQKVKENIENVNNYLEDYARTLDQSGKLKLADVLEKHIQFLRSDMARD